MKRRVKIVFLKIGHRGACGYEPENTLRSCRKALGLNVNMIECDVQACKGGEVVVIHDRILDETTNGKGYIVEKYFEELLTLDAGKGEKIPTLEELLDLIDRRVRVNIDLKAERISKAVSDILEKYVRKHNWSYDHFLISSLNHYELLEFSKLNPNVKIGASTSSIPIGLAEFAEKMNAYSIHADQDFINQNFVADAHHRGIKVFVSTVNDPAEIKRIKALNVDGIFSDYPDRL